MAKVAFIQRNLNENLGVMYISACLKAAGHETVCFIDAEEKDLDEAVMAYSPDIIAFTVFSGMHLWSINTARRLKSQSNFVIFGGPHATFFPDVIREECVDAICVGEGEYAMVELANNFPDLERISKIRNLHVKLKGRIDKNKLRELITDLDELPQPDREIFYRYKSLRDNPRKTVIGTRGCPYNCTFCFNSSYRSLYVGKGGYVRHRTSHNIIEEILQIQSRYTLKSVFFQDDTFILDKKWLLDLLSEYKKKVHIPFTCLIRADLVSEEIVSALKEAGCVCVHFGIESGNEGIRNKLLKKNIKDEQIIETARLLRRYNIRFKTYNIIRLPYETIDNAFETVEMNQRIGVDYPWVSMLVPYPKTELTEYMIDNKLLCEDYNVDDLAVSFFTIKKPTRDDWPFINLQRLFFYAVKIPILCPLIRRLIYLPPNIFFDGLFFLSHAYNYRGSENTNIKDVLYFGFKSLKTSL